jgi:hypothetical protein
VAYGTECHDIDECLETRPCLNGGTCLNLLNQEMYRCICPYEFSGKDCDLTVLPSGIITTSTDFIIALIVCILVMLSKY